MKPGIYRNWSIWKSKKRKKKPVAPKPKIITCPKCDEGSLNITNNEFICSECGFDITDVMEEEELFTTIGDS